MVERAPVTTVTTDSTEEILNMDWLVQGQEPLLVQEISGFYETIDWLADQSRLAPVSLEQLPQLLYIHQPDTLWGAQFDQRFLVYNTVVVGTMWNQEAVGVMFGPTLSQAERHLDRAGNPLGISLNRNLEDERLPQQHLYEPDKTIKRGEWLWLKLDSQIDNHLRFSWEIDRQGFGGSHVQIGYQWID